MINYHFRSRYSHYLLLGLLCSSIGDALLDYKDGSLFPFGMMAFGFAQIFYISAFGFQPLRLPIACLLYGLGIASIAFMFQNLEGILVFGFPIYAALLLTMGWRAVARVQVSC